jgi:DNA-binding GntR family transcriptional regulator
MQISSNRKYMEEIALTDNRLILEFLLKRDEEGASHAMSIHMKHLIHSMQNEA